MHIDLRSDTVTRPTPEMRRVIAEAEVGDDVYHDDPTVLALERHVADLLGKDDAMYTPTGTLANQTAISAHTRPGDIVLAGQDAHLHIHELGAPYVISGVTLQFLESSSTTGFGIFDGHAVRNAVPEIPRSMPSSLFQPVTLVAVENTHNAAGGTVWPQDLLDEVTSTAGAMGLGTHMDGARLWNAAVASGRTEAEITAGFDTVSVCFSKGLGAPMGSALVGDAALISRARRGKQMLGGGMRQAGMMAAGALYGVTHHRDRLAEDHENARRLAELLANVAGVSVDPAGVATNMVYFDVTGMSASEFADRTADAGVAWLPLGPTTIRAVTNLEVGAGDILKAVTIADTVLRAV